MFSNQNQYQQQTQQQPHTTYEGGDLQLGEHNLFNEYDPALQYRSIFRYFQIPKDDLTSDDGTKKSTSIEKMVSCFIIIFMYLAVIITFPITGFFTVKKIKPLERCLVYRLGQRLPLKGPGIHLHLPCIDNLVKIDLNKKEFKIENEPLLTSDGSLIEIQEFRAILSISNVVKSITQVKDSEPTVEQFVKIAFKNMISSSHLDDIERKLSVLIMTFVTNINISLANWGWSVQITDLPKIIVKNRYESKSQVISLLKSYFDPAAKPANNLENQNSLQMLKQAIFGNANYQLMEEEKCDQCSIPEMPEPMTMTQKLEKIADRYTHMNVFNHRVFNINLVINGQESLFYAYDTKTKVATKKDKIDDKIHFTVNCRSMEDFQQFVDNNDTSGIELTTKLF